MNTKFTLAKKGLLALSIPLSFQILFFLGFNNLLNQAQFLGYAQYQQKEVIGRTNWLAGLLILAASSSVGSNLTKDKDYQSVGDWAQQNCEAEVAALPAVLQADALQKQELAKIGALWSNLQVLQKQIKASSLKELKDLLCANEFKSIWTALYDARHTILARELNKYQMGPSALADVRRSIQLATLVGVIMDVSIALYLMYLFTKGITKRLSVLSENSLKLADNQPLNLPLSGSDEIARLDHTFHSVAARLMDAKQQLEANEHRIRSIIENMPMGIIVVDANGMIELINSTAESMFAASNADLANQPFVSLLAAPGDVTDATNMITSASDTRPFRSRPLTAMRAKGTTFPVEIMVKEFQAPQGDRLLVVLEDVSEKQEVERLKQELVAIVSHELRTPLTSIGGFLTMLTAGLYGPLSTDGLSKTAVAERNVEHLIKLVNDLLTVEKMETGSTQLALQPTAISSVVRRSLEAVQQIAERCKVSIVVRDNSDDTDLHLDPDRMIQVLINLLSNAIKYSPQEGIITLDITQNSEWLEIRVTDKGRGIPLSDQTRVFGRFQQVRREDGLELGGTGLGLTICKTIVEQHGGTIGVESIEGEGSSFWLRIPRKSLKP